MFTNESSYHYSETHQEVYVYFLHSLFIQAVIIVIINVFSLWIIIRSGRIYKKLQNIYLMGLLLSHGLNGLSFVLYYVLVNMTSVSKTLLYHVKMMRDTFYIFSACYTTMIALDRYLAIKRPFYYTTLGKRFVIISNSLIVLISVVVKLAFVLTTITTTIIAFLVILIFSASVGFFNYVLYREVKKQYVSINSMTVYHTNEAEAKHKKYIKRRQLRSLKICLLLTFSYVLFWLPYVVTVLLYQMFKTFLMWKVRSCLELFNLFNSIVDVVIYVSLNNDMKQEMKKFFFLCIRRRQNIK